MVQLEVEFEKLQVTRERLLDEIASLSFVELNQKPGSSSWSVAQVCHHLFLSEKSFTKAIIYGLKQSDQKTAPKPIHLLNDRTKKVNAPDFTKPGDEPLELEQIVRFLKESRALLLDVLNKIEDKSVLETKSVRHPFFGDLPLYQWIEIVYLHEQRHIEQIQEIKSQFI